MVFGNWGLQSLSNLSKVAVSIKCKAKIQGWLCGTCKGSDSVLLIWSPVWLVTHSPPAPPSQVLGLQAGTTKPGFPETSSTSLYHVLLEWLFHLYAFSLFTQENHVFIFHKLCPIYKQNSYRCLCSLVFVIFLLK
jgi:hypothetical protein